MVYGYIRVSTDRQTVENQRFEILKFCEKEKIKIEQWIEETVSGKKELDKRLLGILLKDIKPNDLIICSEFSRLGRSLYMILTVIEHCLKIGVRLWTIKECFRLGEDMQSRVMVFTFGLAAEIERMLIVQRTKEALARVKAEGKKLGRQPGQIVRVKLSGHEKEIKQMVKDGWNNVQIGKHFGVHFGTVREFKRNRLYAKTS